MSDRKLVKAPGKPGYYRRGKSWVTHYRDADGDQRKVSGRTYEECRVARQDAERAVREGQHADPRRTFASYAEDWMDTYTGRTSRGVKKGTRDDYCTALRAHAIPYFGKRKMIEIGPMDVKRFVKQLADDGKSGTRAPGTVANLFAPVRALFATALEDGVVNRNPCAGVRLPRGTVRKVQALTDAELAALLRETPEGAHRLLLRFLADTGLRIGEATGLRWENLDLGSRRVKVTERLYRGERGEPKSKYGIREVPLSVDLAQALWAHRKDVSSGDDDPVFPAPGGGPMRREYALRSIVKPPAKRAGVEWAGLHTLRHTCATRLFRGGANAKQVQIWLGHHSAAYTLDTYVHLLPSDLPDPDEVLAFTPPGPEGATPGASRQGKITEKADTELEAESA